MQHSSEFVGSRFVATNVHLWFHVETLMLWLSLQNNCVKPWRIDFCHTVGLSSVLFTHKPRSITSFSGTFCAFSIKSAFLSLRPGDCRKIPSCTRCTKDVSPSQHFISEKDMQKDKYLFFRWRCPANFFVQAWLFRKTSGRCIPGIGLNLKNPSRLAKTDSSPSSLTTFSLMAASGKTASQTICRVGRLARGKGWGFKSQTLEDGRAPWTNSQCWGVNNVENKSK